MKFSANLGFLWTELPLPQAVEAAARAGFEAVEFHWPYEADAAALRRAIDVTGVQVMGLNTRRGNLAAGEFGLSALPGRGAEARAAVDEALDWAMRLGAGAVHVLSGRAGGAAAQAAYLETLEFATSRAAVLGLTILIEPLNRFDAPGTFLDSTERAAAVIAELGADNLKIMFDCYHVGRTEGGVVARLAALAPLIGHVQIAAVPDRGAPDHGELDYARIYAALRQLGWTAPIGAEYRPGGPTGDSLGWLAAARAA